MTASKQRPRGRTHQLAKLHAILERRLREQGHIICHLCGRPVNVALTDRDESLEWDHLVPVSVDPVRAESITNLAPAHRRCNRERGDMPLNEWWKRTATGRPASRRWL
ncbi:MULTISPECIES: HNH endonuclease [Gordonia]|uniref:HNH endonuclease n=1 Tax=Gordonia TaxID=2053 RepID=UPI00128EB6C5